MTVPVVVATTPERAFDWFADYKHVAQVLDGVTRWEPIGAQTQGLGARYAVSLLILTYPMQAELRLDRWCRPLEIGWVTDAGYIRQRGTFTFAPEGSLRGHRPAN